jgi:Domain of unknown function (DUF4365)
MTVCRQGMMTWVNGQGDLPGYSSTQETEELGLLAVQTYLVQSGFKTTEVTGRFDDGLDLLVSPHDEHNVLPAVAGIQVRSGPSHRGLKVGRHERYWREHNLPVFGVVLTDPRPPTAQGGWCDAQEYLRTRDGASFIPTPNSFPEGFADALHAACDRRRSIIAALDIFDTDWRRQATAVASLVPLALDPRVARLLRSRIVDLGPRASHYALYLLAVAEELGIDTEVSLGAVAHVVQTLYEEEVDGQVDLDAFHGGTAAAYTLLKARRADPHLLVQEAIALHSGEPTILLIAMAVSLAGDGGAVILEEALRKTPNLWQNSDIAAISEALSEGGYEFLW